MKKTTYLLLASCLLLGCLCVSGCGEKDKVVIYSNADDEAVAAMQCALDKAGYRGRYAFQVFSTSELGGKVIAEGGNIEADLLTLSSYYLESAQAKNKMFRPLAFTVEPLSPVSSCFAPVTGQEGAIFVNTNVMQERGVRAPQSLKDLARPEYRGLISIPNIKSSSTAWLMVQALVDAYGEDGARDILRGMIANAGPHLENSGSAPLKKLRAGEVAIAFGLRQQAVADKKAGLPIDYIDPAEGTFSLTECVAVPDKGAETKPLAMKMAETIVRQGRAELIQIYPVPLYRGETATSDAQSQRQKRFPLPLTVDLLQKHEKLMETR